MDGRWIHQRTGNVKLRLVITSEPVSLSGSVYSLTRVGSLSITNMKGARLLLLIAALAIAGCGPSGGTIGDVNDPAVDGSDAEQMADETGDV